MSPKYWQATCFGEFSFPVEPAKTETAARPPASHFRDRMPAARSPPSPKINLPFECQCVRIPTYVDFSLPPILRSTPFSVGACVCMVDFPPSWLDTSCTTKISFLHEGSYENESDHHDILISSLPWEYLQLECTLQHSPSFLSLVSHTWARGFVSIFLVILANTLAPPTGRYPYIRGYLNLDTDSYLWIKFHFLLVSSRANFKSARWIGYLCATKTHANSQKYERTSAHTLSVFVWHTSNENNVEPFIFWFLAATNKSKQQRRIIESQPLRHHHHHHYLNSCILFFVDVLESECA